MGASVCTAGTEVHTCSLLVSSGGVLEGFVGLMAEGRAADATPLRCGPTLCSVGTLEVRGRVVGRGAERGMAVVVPLEITRLLWP